MRLTLGVATSVFWKLVAKGLSFYFINDNLFVRPGDENNLEKQLIMLIKFDASHNMASELGKRILDTLELRIRDAQKGQALGWGTFLPGYIVHREAPTDHFEWDTINYPTLMRLVNEALDPARKSLHSIATDLNEESVPTFKDGRRIRQGKKSWNVDWTATTIRRILTSSALIGTLHFKIKKKGREREVTLEHYLVVDGKPAVTQEQWVKLQARFLKEKDEENPKGAGGGSSESDRVMSLFPGMVKCAVSGRGMRARHSHRSKRDDMSYRQWLCRGMQNHSSTCNHPTFYCDPLEAHFFTSYLRKGPDELSAERDEQLAQKLDAARIEMAGVSEQIVALLQKNSDPKYKGCEDEINAVLAPLLGRKVLLNEQIAALEAARVAAPCEDKAIKEIWDILRGDEVDVDALLANSERFMCRLHDRSVRRKLLGPIKSIVSRVEINANTEEYRITLKSGLASGWMNVATGIKAIKQMHSKRSEEFRQRASARTTEWHKKNKLSPEAHARGNAKRAATRAAKSPEEIAAWKARISAAARAQKPEFKRKAREKQCGLGLSRNPKAQLKRWAQGMAERRKAALKDPAKAEAKKKAHQAASMLE
jgi:hypothetical protein